MKKKYKIRLQRPWIAYPGSTIMQSYGETPGKGYLFWDIKSRNDFDVKFIPIPHDREFRTIDWKGDVEKTIKEAEIPKGSRVRVRSDSLLSQVDIKHVSSALRKIGASEVVFKDEYSIDAKSINLKTMQIQKSDIRDPKVLSKLFREYFQDENIKPDEWKGLDDLIDSYVRRLQKDDSIATNNRWSLHSLEFDNLFGYGKGNYINFQSLAGITGIFGQNRIGKSSIIGTLLYALFNGTDRGAIKNLHIINSRKKYCQATLKFAVNQKLYQVERQTVRQEQKKTGVQHGITNLNLFALDDKGNKINDLNGEQRRDTEKSIRDLIGSVEDCLLTGIATQGGMNRFIEHGSAYRDQVISRFLDLIIFEKMLEYSKQDSQLIRAKVSSAPDRDWDSLITEYSREFDQSVFESQSLDKELKLKREKLNGLQLNLSKLDPDHTITQSDVDSCRNEIDSLLKSAKNNQGIIEKNQAAIIEFKNKLDSLKLLRSNIDVAALKKEANEVHEVRQQLTTAKHNLSTAESKLDLIRKSVTRLKEVPCGDQYPMCKFIRDSHDDKGRLEDQKTIVNVYKDQVETLAKLSASINPNKIKKQLEEFTQFGTEISTIELEISRLNHEIDNKTRDNLEFKRTLNELEIKLTNMVCRVSDATSKELERLKLEIRKLESQIDIMDNRRVKLAGRKGWLESEISRLTVERDHYRELQKQWRIYELFNLAVAKKGIPAQIIHSQLPLINSEIARILHGIVTFTVKIEKETESNSTEIYIDYGDSKRLIELGSGMEKMISSMAIRVALQNASTIPRPDFLIIDEGFGALDELNIDACNRLLLTLKQWYRNIVVISHVDGIKDIADNMIEITRKEKDSYVRFD